MNKMRASARVCVDSCSRTFFDLSSSDLVALEELLDFVAFLSFLARLGDGDWSSASRFRFLDVDVELELELLVLAGEVEVLELAP